MRVSYRPICTIVDFALLVIVVSFLASWLRGALPFSPLENRLIIELFFCTSLIAAFLWFSARIDGQRLSATPLYPTRKRLKKCVVGILVGFIMIGAVSLWNGIIRAVVSPAAASPEGGPQPPLLLAIIFFLGALWEETAFRGYLLQRLSTLTGPHVACLCIAALFGAVHLLSPLAGPQIVISTFLSGLLLGYAYLFSGDLYLPIGLHFAWNFFQRLLFPPPFVVQDRFWGGIAAVEQGAMAMGITAAGAFIFFMLFHCCPAYSETARKSLVTS